MCRNHFIRTDCLDWMRKQPDNQFDLTFGSPPYVNKGQRYDGCRKSWPIDEWVPWMADVTDEAIRITDGRVIWVANGAVRQGEYLPACELLICEARKRGIQCERPFIWSSNKPPNARGNWFGNDWEFVLAFRRAGTKPFFDWEAVAEPPKYKAGGHFRQRDSKGKRRRGSDYPKNKLARPRDILRIPVGGGLMGHPLAHESEAPFPLKLAEHFVLSCCPPGGCVLDPFIGSGTTAHAALLHGRYCVGLDIRRSQIDLTRRRLADVREQLNVSQ